MAQSRVNVCDIEPYQDRSEKDTYSTRDQPLEPEVLTIEADSASVDSAYGESVKSGYLTSIASEVLAGTMENGRRYHSYGSAEYAFPNDDRECIACFGSLPDYEGLTYSSRTSRHATCYDDFSDE